MADVDDYPSLYWIAIPSLLLLSGWYARKWYLARRLKVHGIGKGAPGFQTSVRKVRVPPEIMERIRRGEDVSAEEVTAAMARMEAEEKGNPPPSTSSKPQKSETKIKPKPPPAEPANEWLPEGITAPQKRAKGKKK
ncbi:hypothetical protein MIND_00865300 [Mycena indigotica]|uniref:Uncharacterized protein n=1 Tax=Mycena indigotica TaxID=2126181 RepID=A0A8H6SGP9_9AGAR|nr:uncharacterized protein MIND_00865300 [Mycena indigotica]KAF7299166.1 hypothetical protein MIND_00865300 [Mycena indigotica]